jgi:uracil-DNA glycosylase
LSEEPAVSEELIRAQLLLRARQLRGAGVEWLSAAEPLAISMPASAEESPVGASSLAASTTIGLEIVDAPFAEMALTMEERLRALDALAAEIKQCMRCAELCSTRTQTVFGQGKPGVELCFVGEAPGADEDKQGIPFVGAAGQLLNKIIAASGFQREEVYICNIIKCRPPANRTPLASEAGNCRDFLERQLALVQPKYIVALGGCAASNLLQTTVSIGKLRGRFHDFRGIPVMVTYHPAFLLPHRSPEKKREVWEDMKWLLQKMGRPIPQKES